MSFLLLRSSGSLTFNVTLHSKIIGATVDPPLTKPLKNPIEVIFSHDQVRLSINTIISYFISHISYLIFHISYFISHISYLISHISYLIFHISYPISYISYPTSHIPYPICNIYRTRKRSLPRYQNTEKCVEKRGRRPSFLTTSRCFETVVKNYFEFFI